MMKIRLRCVVVCAMLLVISIPSFGQGSDDRAQQNQSPKIESDKMELIIFARFHAREGEKGAVATELRDAVARVSKERGASA